jgi:hypothetical protein
MGWYTSAGYTMLGTFARCRGTYLHPNNQTRKAGAHVEYGRATGFQRPGWWAVKSYLGPHSTVHASPTRNPSSGLHGAPRVAGHGKVDDRHVHAKTLAELEVTDAKLLKVAPYHL